MSKLLIGLYVAFSSTALIFLKLGSKSGAPIGYLNNKVHFNITPYIVGGIVFYGTSFLLYTYLISKFDLGYIIPLTTALIYIIIFTASYFVFKESFTIPKIIGIVLILIGIILLNLKR